ncbi:hypothetical protein B0H17DRAFT_1149472 [Mycena rosella]|uniref:Uncharacterized protein n=1 Tax=Mycena rosella TaxID=1033263 RepID=A0AAD7FQF2_MYCRO|nr:hypothetical protein B0H17DRAFT_1149472 [Mycena rosella]
MSIFAIYDLENPRYMLSHLKVVHGDRAGNPPPPPPPRVARLNFSSAPLSALAFLALDYHLRRPPSDSSAPTALTQPVLIRHIGSLLRLSLPKTPVQRQDPVVTFQINCRQCSRTAAISQSLGENSDRKDFSVDIQSGKYLHWGRRAHCNTHTRDLNILSEIGKEDIVEYREVRGRRTGALIQRLSRVVGSRRIHQVRLFGSQETMTAVIYEGPDFETVTSLFHRGRRFHYIVRQWKADVEKREAYRSHSPGQTSKYTPKICPCLRIFGVHPTLATLPGFEFQRDGYASTSVQVVLDEPVANGAHLTSGAKDFEGDLRSKMDLDDIHTIMCCGKIRETYISLWTGEVEFESMWDAKPRSDFTPSFLEEKSFFSNMLSLSDVLQDGPWMQEDPPRAAGTTVPRKMLRLVVGHVPPLTRGFHPFVWVVQLGRAHDVQKG